MSWFPSMAFITDVINIQVEMTVQSIILAQTKYLGFGIKIISTDFDTMM